MEHLISLSSVTQQSSEGMFVEQICFCQGEVLGVKVGFIMIHRREHEGTKTLRQSRNPEKSGGVGKTSLRGSLFCCLRNTLNLI